MSTVNVKMTAIADEIRTLSGTTDPMGLDAMATNVGDANTKVDNQADLLSQVLAAIATKAAPAATYTIHMGTAEPTSDIGNDGDIYIMKEASE